MRLRPSTACVTPTDAADGVEVELVRRAQAGDADAFGTLVDRNRRAVFRAAVAALGSAADAEDVTQDAFVTAYQKLDTFRGDAAFRTWLLAIAWRKAIDRRKSIVRWLQRTVTPHDPGESGGWDVFDAVPDRDRSQEDQVLGREFHDQVRALIASLPKKLRDTLLLAGSGEYSYDQIASMLKIPVGTVKWRVSEARRVVKQKLKAIGYEHAG
jgi:RNA polymerase sigma-70 factor, ECF subfamily